MRTLESARDLCDQYHEGLVKALAAIPPADREVPGSPVIELFRTHNGPALLIPEAFGGLGADALDSVRVQRAVGSLSPSLAVAAAMHHFTAATLFSLAREEGRLTPAQIEMLHGVAPGSQLMASGWAEGRTQTNILVPSVTAAATDHGYLLSGSKKPCSLARSMDLLTTSVAVPGTDGAPELALALTPADVPGLSVHPFWGNEVLAASESDEVRLQNVFVPAELIVRVSADDPHRLDDLQTTGFVWFTLLISAAYVGAASALIEQVVECGRGSAGDRTALVVRGEAAFALLEGAARAGVADEAAVAKVLVARYAVQDLIAQAVADAMELLGGIDFVRSSDNARLAAVARALAFHPPSRGSTAEPLLRWFTGGSLELA
ncbi:acyl-CoA/acyl-ACP dehydrogenase [Frankia sp. Ag45/Mut15]|uniref:Acyl-CoA/acyl-ACP dehydrogenase n=1 Tax=Frankia umida TaxID=573489 RepID=A0ABT0K413_9ACTN|nr:acyl-CoA dehydrogenase family protein [Frankia umida]MCK9878546.1 acyl-CoA/acyl-ACP dehydrogenase [Frankia umida]